MTLKFDATSIIERINSGQDSVEDTIKRHLDHLTEYQPKINAATEIFTKKAIEQSLKPQKGILTGLPISIKECFAMAGCEVTLGSIRMPPIECNEDATIVKKLRDEGAIILARTNTSEFLLDRESDNLRFGRTSNWINSSLTCGGSSGGEGAMVGSGCTAAGMGTDIGGSIRIPSAFNGLVGFKPASSSVDKTGIYPSSAPHFAETMNGIGPFARSVRDIRLLYNVIANKPLIPFKNLGDIRLITPQNFQLKIHDDSISKALLASTTGLIKLGLHPEKVEMKVDSGQLYLDYLNVMVDGFLEKVYEMSITSNGQEFSLFSEIGRKIIGKPTMSKNLFMTTLGCKVTKPSASKVIKSEENIKRLRVKYQEFLGNNGVMILPTLGVLAMPHGKFNALCGKPGIIPEITPITFCNVLDLPAITIPAWKFQKDSHSSPPAVMLICSPNSEYLLLKVAEMVESIIG